MTAVAAAIIFFSQKKSHLPPISKNTVPSQQIFKVMALINCYECNREISDRANACPYCGAPIEVTDIVPVSEETSLVKSNIDNPVDLSIIENIHEIRGYKVMLDFDLAEQYGVENKYLKRAVRNNIKRFEGEDFMFELTREELSRCKNCTLNKGRGSNIKYLPFAFTELGVAMLSGVLNSDTAIDANRRIMRAFVAIRQYLMTYAELKHELYDFMQQTNTRLDKTDAQLDSSNMKVDEVFKMLKEIFEQKNAFENRQRIGFNAHRE